VDWADQQNTSSQSGVRDVCERAQCTRQTLAEQQSTKGQGNITLKRMTTIR